MDKPKIKFYKIKISDDDEISIDYAEHTPQGLKDVSEASPYKPHDDFKKVFQDLVPHVCNLSEQFGKDGKTIPEIYDPSEGKKNYMRCCGISISGDDDKEKVVFTAVRYLSTGKTVLINTPMLYTSAEEKSYPKMDELVDVLVRLSIEAKAFLFDGKYAADPQLDMFKGTEVNAGEGAGGSDDDGAKGKGKGKNKKKDTQEEEN